MRALYLAIPFCGLATGGLYPVIALHLASRGFDELTIGAVTTAWYIGAFFGSASYASVVHRMGHKPAFTAVLVVAGLATWGLAATSSPAAWMALRGLAGYALGGYYVVVESWISRSSSDRVRGRLLAFYESARIAAVAAGPIVLNLVETPGALFLAGSFLLGGACMIRFAPAPEPSAERGQVHNFAVVFRRGAFPMFCIFASGLVIGSFYGLGAVYAQQLGLSTSSIAIFTSVCLLAPVLTQLPTGTIGDRYGRIRTALIVSTAGTIPAALLAAGAAEQPILVIALGAGALGLAQPLYALGVSHALAALSEDDALRVVTASLIAYNAGTAIGPIAAGQAMEWWGGASLYGWITACLAAVAIAGLAESWAAGRQSARLH